MTREEAINVVEGARLYLTAGNPIWDVKKVNEAMIMAIEALKEQEISNELQEYAYECGYEHFFHECQNCEHRRSGNKPNYETDTEVRLAVTDRNKDKVVLWDSFGEVEYYPCDTSETQFYDEDDYWNGRVPTHGRLIDVDALMEYCSNQKTKTISNNDIARFPTVQADRPSGKWIYCEDENANYVDGYRCSHCGFFVPWDYIHKSIYFIEDYNFCPSCGADMRGENK